MMVVQIAHLKDAGKTTKEIAQALNLKRLQVAAIIAHRQIAAEARQGPEVSDSAASTMAVLEEPPEVHPMVNCTLLHACGVLQDECGRNGKGYKHAWTSSSPRGAEMIECINLWKQFACRTIFTAVSKVELKIERGEISVAVLTV